MKKKENPSTNQDPFSNGVSHYNDDEQLNRVIKSTKEKVEPNNIYIFDKINLKKPL